MQTKVTVYANQFKNVPEQSHYCPNQVSVITAYFSKWYTTRYENYKIFLECVYE